jgi:hypothetical protein
MASQDFLQSRALAAQGIVAQVGTDTPVALRLKAKAAAGLVTSVTVTTATNIVAITANGGTETWAFATYDTVGKLADVINASAYWECKILDSLRSYATANQFVTGAIASSTTDGVTYYDVKVDTSTAKYFAYRLTSDRSVGQDKPKGSHRVHLLEFVYYATLGGANADMVLVYEVKGTVETQKIAYTSVSATKTTENFASGQGYHTSADGSELVVVLKDASSLGDATANYLRVVGKLE